MRQKLEALAPKYLIAKADCQEARASLAHAKRRHDFMLERIEAHAAEIAAIVKGRSGYPMATSAQILDWGSGSGYEVVYLRCRCETDCGHDPKEAPYSATDLEAARQVIVKADTALARATKKLADTEPHIDAYAEAGDARYIWWPDSKYIDPRRYRWQGKPLTDDDVDNLGPHELHRLVTAGSVIEVPS